MRLSTTDHPLYSSSPYQPHTSPRKDTAPWTYRGGRRTFGSRKTAATPSPARCSAAWPTQQRWRRGLDTGGYKRHHHLRLGYFNDIFHH